MKYQINKENYRRFDIMAVNKLPERSYFIPFSSKEKADQAKLLTKRYCSDKVTSLSCYSGSAHIIFRRADYDTDCRK